jgi:ABC-type glutathione transport system ATPase component
VPSDPALLQVEDLAVDLAENGGLRPVIAGVSMTIGASEIVGLFGDSGCGKTTLALALMGLLPPHRYRVRGSVRVHGGVSFVFQDPLLALNPVLRVRDQVAEVMRAHGGGDVETALELVRLPVSARLLKAYPHQLSGGERQRVLLALALAARPALVIADEPFTALDVIRVVELAALFVDLKERLGVSFLTISHSPGVLARIADSVLVMRAGRIVERGAPREVFRQGAPAAAGWTHGA